MKRTIAPVLDAALDRFTAYPERMEQARRELRALKAVANVALGGHECSSISCTYCQRMGRALSRLDRARSPGRSR